MWKPYLHVIRERCSNAVHILDRFHIVAKMNKALDEVRAGEARRLAQDGYKPVLKRTRWCVLKRKINLTGKQRFRLRELLRYNLKTARAYLLKEDFQQFWEYQSSDVGRQIPRRLVRAGHALAHPADEEDRPDAAQPSRAAPQ
jgi:transposase